MIDKYLIHFRDKGRVIDLDTVLTTSEEFGRIQTAFAVEAGGNSRAVNPLDRYADMVRLYEFQKVGNIYYNYDLCCDGGYYRVYRLPEHSDNEIERIINFIRHSFDVVRLNVVKIKEMI